MNPRLFCRQPTYECAVCITYSFDPIFFERVILPELWAGGSNDILVIADAAQATEAIARSGRDIRQLGRRYQLATAGAIGAQHAKLILRLGRDGGLIWIGSNNLAAPTWSGGNRELASAWQVRPNDNKGAAELKHLLVIFSALVPRGARNVLERAMEYEWLASVEPDKSLDSQILISGSAGTLAEQLGRRWRNRRFDRASVLTGSTDQNGAMLRWLIATFGVRKIIVGLDPARSAFQASKLEKLPATVKIVPLKSYPVPHAKLIWLEGKKGNAAVMGSANCSASAWLMSPAKGGNVESVLVFDECDRASLRGALDLCPEEEAVLPAEIAGLGTVAPQTKPSIDERKVKLLELSCNANLGELRAIVESAIVSPTVVEVEISDFIMPLRVSSHDERMWLGPMPDVIEGKTEFGRMVVHYGGKRVEHSNFVWLNDEVELQYSIRTRQISDAIGGLSRPPATPDRQRQLVQRLTQVAAVLFSDRVSFADPIVGVHKKDESDKGSIEPTDPDQLVKGIDELKEIQHSRMRGFGVPGLPIVGVMRVLFPSGEPAEDDFSTEENDEESDKGSKSPRERSVRQPSSQLGEQVRKLLVTQIDRFLSKLAKPEFAEHCTATQLVQAAAFPLAVVNGGARRWVDR
jgi:hypothetical protein